MIYLDNNATTRPADAVVDTMGHVLRELWGNPSSVHRFGQQIRQRVELARQQTARLVGAEPARLTFTSGGAEANNLALRGTLELAGARPAALITTALEHAAIREPAAYAQQHGVDLRNVRTDASGLVDLDNLSHCLDDAGARADLVLVTIQWANNETGGVQPIPAIADAIAAARQRLRDAGRRTLIVWHVDATQAVGKLPVDFAALPIDLASFAAHKFHGPKGVGGLYARAGVRLVPQQRGGPQEHERRAGTENTPAIVGMGVAAQLAGEFLDDESRRQSLAALRDRFEQTILAGLDRASVNAGPPRHADAPRLWNTSNIAFRGLEAEAILLGLSERGVCASAGAACSSGSLEPSPVLLAMGVDEPDAHGSVRFSLSRETTQAELDDAAAAVLAVVQRLEKTMPM